MNFSLSDCFGGDHSYRAFPGPYERVADISALGFSFSSALKNGCWT